MAEGRRCLLKESSVDGRFLTEGSDKWDLHGCYGQEEFVKSKIIKKTRSSPAKPNTALMRRPRVSVKIKMSSRSWPGTSTGIRAEGTSPGSSSPSSWFLLTPTEGPSVSPGSRQDRRWDS